MSATEALNLNLSMLLYAIAGFVLNVILVGIFVLAVIGLIWLVLASRDHASD